MRVLICPGCEALNRVPDERLKDGPRCGKCKTGLPVEPVRAVTSAELEKAVRSSPVPVLVDFWAPWCGPCRGFAPVYEQQALSEPGPMYLKLNTEEHQDAARRFRIQGIPTLIYFSGGAEKARISGALDPESLRGWIRSQG